MTKYFLFLHLMIEMNWVFKTYISDITETMKSVKYNICTMNQLLSQSFKESLCHVTSVMALCSILAISYVYLVYVQTPEEIQSGCRCRKGRAIQEMQVLNRRLVQLEEELAAERNNVMHLHESRALLSAQIRATKVSTHSFSLNRIFFLNLASQSDSKSFTVILTYNLWIADE
jgi:hypothetical protein